MFSRRVPSRRQTGPSQLPEGVAGAALDIGHDLLVVVDARSRIEWADVRFARAVGAPESALIGQPLAQWLDDGSDARHAGCDAVLRGGGAPIPVALRSAPLPNDRRLVACQDLSELRRHQSEAYRLAEQLSAARQLARSSDGARAAQAALELAADFAGIGAWHHDVRARRLTFNDRGWALLGIAPRPDGIARAELLALIHPDDGKAAAAATRRALRGARPVDAQIRLRSGADAWRRLRMRFAAERAPDGALIAFAGVLGDAEAPGSEARAFEPIRRIETIADAAGIGVWSVSQIDGRAAWNASMFRIYGLPPEMMPARPWAERLVHPGDAEPVRQASARWAASREPRLDIEYRIVRGNGSVRSIALTALREQQSLFGAVVDVTALRDAGAALAHADEIIALATRAVGIGIWVRDLTVHEAHWNEQMFRLYGFEPADRPPAHQSFIAAIHPDDRKHVAEMQASLRLRKPCSVQLRVRLPDGRERRIASQSIVVCSERGSVLRQIGVEWDVTEAYAAHQAARERELAEHGTRTKAQFLARIGRELRALLKEVDAFAQLAAPELREDDAKMARLQRMRVSGDRLTALFGDALDLWRIESGQLVLQPQIVPLPKLAAEVLGLVQPLARRHGVRVSASDVEGVVRADRVRLRQVLLNLVANAIKYNHEGGTASLSARAAGERVRISVADDGRGMTEEQLARAFGPFERFGAENDTAEGAGVGLTIAKAIVERMGGAIEATSRPGHGSTFSFDLPSAEEPTRFDDLTTTRAFGLTQQGLQAGGQLLYIEDNPISVLIVEELVRTRTMFAIESAADGASGIAKAIELQPDLILIDLQLPDMDGFEVLRRLRGERATASIPCVALSASAAEDDVERARALGFADYWTKPIDLPTFVRGLERVLSG